MSKKVSSRFLSVLLSVSVLITAINTGISVLANTQEYSGGSGTVSDPYLISSAEDMAQLDADTVAGKTDDKYYKLTADITLTGDFTIGQNRNVKSEISGTQAADKFISDVKAFQGTFDGNQHTVTYTYKNGYAYGGLFSFLDGAVVENLTVEGTADDTNIIFGSVAAVMNDSQIYNCISNVNISNAEVCTGGIVAVMNNSSVVNTENNGSVEQNKGYQSGQTYAGPTQHLQSLFNNSFNFNGSGSIAGGIAALALGDTVFENVLNTGHITNSISPQGVAQTGGILGIAKNPSTAVPNVILRAVGNTGNITGVGGENIRTGGVYGGIEWANYQLDNVWNAGKVSALNGEVRNIKTGSIGGYTYWRNTALGNHRVFAVTGTVDGIDYGVEPYDCKNEFFGDDGVQGTVFICYGGDAYSVIDQYKNSRFDLKSGDKFMKYLGSGWRAVDGYAYPTLAYHFTVGDFNNDGALDILDLVSVKKYISGIGKGTDIVLKAADFDENGKVESTDLASLRKLLLGLSLEDIFPSASKVLRVYSHNVCSHGDVSPGPGGATGQSIDRLPRIWTVISENAPNVVVLTECNSAWAAEIAKRCGYKIAENTRTGPSEIQILYNADDFELIENKVDESERSAFHWVVLKSKATSQQLMVYGYHGSTDGSARNAEITTMSQTISNKKIPTVVAGDFNADYSEFSSKLSDLTRIAEGRAFDKPTWLGWDSMGESTTIDHILYSTDRFDARYFFVLDQKFGDTVLSDHCALLAELEIK